MLFRARLFWEQKSRKPQPQTRKTRPHGDAVLLDVLCWEWGVLFLARLFWERQGVLFRARLCREQKSRKTQPQIKKTRPHGDVVPLDVLFWE